MLAILAAPHSVQSKRTPRAFRAPITANTFTDATTARSNAPPQHGRGSRADLRRPADDRARAHSHLLGHDVLPLRVSGDFDRPLRAERQRRATCSWPGAGCWPGSRRACWPWHALAFSAVTVVCARAAGADPGRAQLLARESAPDARDLRAGGAAVLRGRRRSYRWRSRGFATGMNVRVRGGPRGCRRRMPAADPAAEHSSARPARCWSRRWRRALAAVLLQRPSRAGAHRMAAALVLAVSRCGAARRAPRPSTSATRKATRRPRALQQLEFLLPRRACTTAGTATGR